jgi:hypothetical protein
MRRAEAPDPPASRLDRALLSATALALLFTFGAGAPGDPTGDDPLESPGATLRPLQDGEEPALDSSAAKVEGYLNLRWRSRWSEDSEQDDHDLYGVLGVDLESGGENGWGFHLLGRGAWSADSQSRTSIFYSEQDTHGSELDGDLYHAYFELPLHDSLRLVRVGRMLIHHTPEVAHFDGAQIESEPLGLTGFSVGAYGGSSVHLAEDWPSDEWLAGLYTSFRPWERGQFRVDWMHFEDDDRFGLGENDLVTFGLGHRLLDELRVEGEYSLLDGEDRDMHIKGFLTLPDQELSLRASYYRLFEPERNFAFELNPYFNFLNVYQPYDQGQLVITKGFGEVLEVLGGVDARRVDEQQDVGRFNRDFDRYYVTVSAPDLLPLSTTPSVTGEVWDSPQNDISTWGGDLTSRFNEETQASVGTYYSLYKYYFDLAAERIHVRTYYGEVKHEVSESVALRVRYEYEDESSDSFHSLRLGVTWRF